MKNISKISAGFFTFLMLFLVFAPVALATSGDLFGINYAANVGLGTREIRDMASQVINTLLGVLGIIALVIILIGGFRWMTAAGNEENIASAKKTIAAGLVGLIIIFFAYAIVLFVFQVVDKSVTG
ncbi:MAG: hypothetical protein ABIJ91_04990 [Candidatus Kuenenbacteria bacterium]